MRDAFGTSMPALLSRNVRLADHGGAVRIRGWTPSSGTRCKRTISITSLRERLAIFPTVVYGGSV